MGVLVWAERGSATDSEDRKRERRGDRGNLLGGERCPVWGENTSHQAPSPSSAGRATDSEDGKRGRRGDRGKLSEGRGKMSTVVWEEKENTSHHIKRPALPSSAGGATDSEDGKRGCQGGSGNWENVQSGRERGHITSSAQPIFRGERDRE